MNNITTNKLRGYQTLPINARENIILISNKTTIQSRRDLIPTPLIIESQLTDKSNTDANKIGWVSRFCNGSLRNALDLLDDNYYELNHSGLKVQRFKSTD